MGDLYRRAGAADAMDRLEDVTIDRARRAVAVESHDVADLPAAAGHAQAAAEQP